MQRTARAALGALFLACAPIVHAEDAAAAAPALKLPQAQVERLLATYAMIKRN
jgi:carboxyl-terminal processing protease